MALELFKIFGSVAVKNDEANKSIADTNERAEKLAQKFKTVGSTISDVGTKITVGTGVILTSVGALAKNSISAYADYEQLVGGVETLFGAGGQSLEDYAKKAGKPVKKVEAEYKKLMSAQSTVLNNAKKAYVDAGMSQNEYMETVTSFSASLIQGLKGDTEKASKYAHTAIVDMSDNANKMGTDISMIQNAYQGFAKQNYTMLDNLKLGYGGTKTEMERLIKDASKMKGVQKELGITVDSNSLSFDNIVNAIHVMQTEMGIAGTTTAEAKDTISGSINMMKASWTNLLTGMADDEADFEALLNQLIDSVGTVAKNLIPRIEIVITTALKKVLEGIKSLTGNLPPVFGETIDKLINLVENFRNLDSEQKKQVLSWAGLAVAIGPIITIFGKLISGVGSLIGVYGKLAKNQTVINIFTKLKTVLTTLFNPIKLFSKAFGGLKAIFSSVMLFGSKVALLFSSSGGGLAGVLAVLKTGVMGVVGGFGSLLGTLASVIAPVLAVAGVIYVLWQHWDKVVQTFKNFAENIGLTQKLQEIKDKLQPLWEKIKGLKDLLTVIGIVIGGALSIGLSVLMGLFNGLLTAISPLIDVIGGVIDVLAGLGELIVGIFTGDMEKAGNAVKKIGSGIADVFGGLWGTVKGFLQGFVDGVIGFFHGLWDTLVGHSIVPDTINSITDWFGNLLGKPLEFVKNMKDKVVGFFGSLKDGAVNKAKELASNVSNKYNELKTGAVNKFNDMKTQASEKINSMKTAVVDKATELKNNAVNKFNELKTNAVNKFESLKTSASTKFNSIKSSITGKVSEAKTKAVSLFQDMNNATGGKLGSLVSTVSSKFGDVYTKIKDKMGDAKDKVGEMLGGMKTSFENFGAKIKLPHFKVSNFSLNPKDWVTNGIPKISVEWYKKGGIFDKPTLFNTPYGLKGVGEAGPEAVTPISVLQDYVANAVENSNSKVENKLDNLLNLLSDYLPALMERQMVLDTGVMVGALTPQLDRSLGDLTTKKNRGR